MVGVAGPKPAVDLIDLVLEMIDQIDARDVRAPGLGDVELRQEPSALGPEEIGDRAGSAEVDHRRVDPVLERRLVMDQVHAKASELAHFPHPRIREPDRRHQVALGRGSREPASRSCLSLRPRGEALDPLGIGDLDVPAAGLERVVDEPGAGHRLDDRVDGLGMDLIDPPCERSAGSRRQAGRRAGRRVLHARRAGRRRSFVDSGLIQRATLKWASLVASRLVNNTGEGFTNGRPFFMAVRSDTFRSPLGTADAADDADLNEKLERAQYWRSTTMRPSRTSWTKTAGTSIARPDRGTSSTPGRAAPFQSPQDRRAVCWYQVISRLRYHARPVRGRRRSPRSGCFRHAGESPSRTRRADFLGRLPAATPAGASGASVA